MTPEDVSHASKILNISMSELIQTYASHTIQDTTANGNKDPWIRVKDKDGGCVFLDHDTNQCRIYEARPVQCRTYPFWPDLMASPSAWNEECRRMDDDTTSDLPPWTPEGGGCEGMRLIADDESSMTSNTDDARTEEQDNVSAQDACRQLNSYVTLERRFPRGKARPVD